MTTTKIMDDRRARIERAIRQYVERHGHAPPNDYAARFRRRWPRRRVAPRQPIREAGLFDNTGTEGKP